jgi:hypothetical protein
MMFRLTIENKCSKNMTLEEQCQAIANFRAGTCDENITSNFTYVAHLQTYQQKLATPGTYIWQKNDNEVRTLHIVEYESTIPSSRVAFSRKHKQEIKNDNQNQIILDNRCFMEREVYCRERPFAIEPASLMIPNRTSKYDDIERSMLRLSLNPESPFGTRKYSYDESQSTSTCNIDTYILISASQNPQERIRNIIHPVVTELGYSLIFDNLKDESK